MWPDVFARRLNMTDSCSPSLRLQREHLNHQIGPNVIFSELSLVFACDMAPAVEEANFSYSLLKYISEYV